MPGDFVPLGLPWHGGNAEQHVEKSGGHDKVVELIRRQGLVPDSKPFRDESGYTNWELSADRALSARRALIASGLSGDKIYRVSGQGDIEPLDKADSKGPRNRRLSIIVLRENEGLPAVAPQ